MSLKWLHPFVLVRKYVKPALIRGIHVAPAWRVDNSRSLWEVVETTPKATALLGYELEPKWIVITPRNAGTVIDRREDEEGFYEVYLLWSKTILKVIPWTTKEEDVKMQPKTLWVRPETTKTSSLLINPNPPRKTVGRVTRVHESVKIVLKGALVVFSKYVGVEMELGGSRLLVFKEDEVLAILTEEKG